MTELVLAVDGGNTKTVALTARTDGTIVGAGRAGCGDIYGTPGFEAAVEEIARAVRDALPDGVGAERVGTAVFSLAGADWEEDKEELHAFASELLPRARVAVVNDAIGALRAGADDGVGVSVVCGTGGCVGGRSRDGREWHSSWWALHTGAWAMGGDALQAVYAAELGIGPPTRLVAAALDLYGEGSVEELLHGFTRRGGRDPWDAALLTRSLLRLAREGDGPAERIVRDHGSKLGAMARVAVAKVGLTAPFPLVLLGGVFRGEGSELIVDEIASRVPEADPVRPSYEPVAGALLSALDRAGGRYDPRLVESTMPGAQLFGTEPSRPGA